EYLIRRYERETGKRIMKMMAEDIPSAGTMVIDDRVPSSGGRRRRMSYDGPSGKKGAARYAASAARY
ncbi:MAG: hypothetical protein WC083_02570, partial [Candidatus Methanomethylophilaceae archaeon]